VCTRAALRTACQSLLPAGVAAFFHAAVLVGAACAQATPAIRGFAPARVAAQRELEETLKRVPHPAQAEKHLRALTSEPHMAGTEGGRRVAVYIRDQMRSFGLEAELVSYRVLLPHPVEVSLQLTAPEKKKLATPEEPFQADRDTSNPRAVMGFNGYSPSGDVTAPVVYANYGLPEDYKRLAELGVSAEGKIVLVRYGQCFRGVKVKVAEENKAAAVIIFSDPADDGYAAGDPYPRGPFRPPSGIQRGSVYYGFVYPGDPLTPGEAATENAKRIPAGQAQNLPRIPAMPINWRDAQEILSRMEGPRVPREWQGGVPVTYHTGPGPATARIRLKMDFQLRTIWDVVGKLPGTSDDEWVVMGNHHDAWVFGAVDPSSGTAAMLETARALGELARGGWKPRRTILLCAWDAEEFGLIGSTEWVEQHRSELQRKAVAYVNLDSAVSGSAFGSSAAPSLRELVRDAAREVSDPKTGRSVYDVWRERSQRGEGRRRATAGADPAPLQAGEPQLGVLGSGSDFTPFFHHAGIPSLDLGFSGEYGVYHALYDNFFWMKKFGDPDFTYHAAASRLAGILLLRLSESDVLPLDYAAYATEIERYVRELELTAGASGKGRLNLKPVSEGAAAMLAAAGHAAAAMNSAAVDREAALRINRALVTVEQELLSPQGLVGRPWYKHTIYAPGTYTGYAAVLLPGIREAVDRGDWETAQREAGVVAEALHRAAARLAQVR